MNPAGPAGLLVLATGTAALNVPFGWLKAGAARRSPRWFGVYAAALFLLIGVRYAFDVSGVDILLLIAAMQLGQWLGRRTAHGDPEPSAPRWRTVTYAALLAGLLLLIGAPVHAHQAIDHDQYERLETDEPAPAFRLIDQNGKRLALADLRGKVVIVTFLFTQCTEVCPLLPQMLALVDQHLTNAEKARLRYVGITVDPRHDTPERLRAFMQQRGLSDQRWTLLTGSLAQLTKTASDYGVVVRPDPRAGFVHNTVFVVIDGNGHERVEFHGLATPTQEIAQAVRALLAPPVSSTPKR